MIVPTEQIQSTASAAVVCPSVSVQRVKAAEMRVWSALLRRATGPSGASGPESNEGGRCNGLRDADLLAIVQYQQKVPVSEI